MTKIPREDLLAEIQRLADGDTPPSATDMRADGAYTDVTYHHRFGSWREALEAAGFDSPQQEYTADELVANLRAFAEELGHSPTSTEMDEAGPHAPRTYRTQFGSWGEALDAADLDPVTRGYSGDELFAELRRLRDDLGRVPKSTDLETHGRITLRPYVDRWGSFAAALEAAGIDPESG